MARYMSDAKPGSNAYESIDSVVEEFKASLNHIDPSIGRTRSQAIGIPDQDQRSVSLDEVVMTPDLEDWFFDNVKLTGDVDETTRWFIRACDAETARSMPRAQDKLRENIEFEEDKLRGNLSDEERRKAQESLAAYRRELDKPVFNSCIDLSRWITAGKKSFFARYYGKEVRDGRDRMAEALGAIQRLKDYQKDLVGLEKKLAAEQDEANIAELEEQVLKRRDDVQQAAEAAKMHGATFNSKGEVVYDEKAQRAKLVPPDIESYRTFDELEQASRAIIKAKTGETVV